MGYYNSKQFRVSCEEKEDMISALTATVGGMSVDVLVGTVRLVLAAAEHSGSDTVAITIGLERLVSLALTVASCMGQELDEAVGRDKVSSDGEPGAGSVNQGRLFRRYSLCAQQEMSRSNWSVVPT